MSSHPEFICVGAQKAGTSWLYDQARSHPRVWMPPIKELRYFNKFGRLAERATAQLEKKNQRRKPVDSRDIAFLVQASKASNGFKASDLSEYSRCFEPAGELVTGDISPAYDKLSKQQITLLREALPNSRFIFFVRDPVERLWSQVNMMVRYRKVSETVLTDIDEFKKFSELPSCRVPSFQSRHIRRWKKILGDQRFRVFKMKDLKADASRYRRAVFEYIGLNGDECTIAADFNKKASDRKVTMPDSYCGFLQGYFEEEYDRLSRLVGGI